MNRKVALLGVSLVAALTIPALALAQSPDSTPDPATECPFHVSHHGEGADGMHAAMMGDGSGMMGDGSGMMGDGSGMMGDGSGMMGMGGMSQHSHQDMTSHPGDMGTMHGSLPGGDNP